MKSGYTNGDEGLRVPRVRQGSLLRATYGSRKRGGLTLAVVRRDAGVHPSGLVVAC